MYAVIVFMVGGYMLGGINTAISSGILGFLFVQWAERNNQEY